MYMYYNDKKKNAIGVKIILPAKNPRKVSLTTTTFGKDAKTE